MKQGIEKLFLSGVFLLTTFSSFSQMPDSTVKTAPVKNAVHFSGSVGVTNNGISIIPTFSLNKPALITNFSLAKGKFSFEPDLSFSLEGRPWQFLFWFRYKMIDHEKFKMRIGAHPAFTFVDETETTNGIDRTHMVTQHYAALEIAPNYFIKKDISIGIYYLYGRGLQPDAIKFTHFVTLNANFSKIRLSKQFYLGITPQFYYLIVPSQDGVYYTTNLTLGKEKLPLLFSLFGNVKIKSDITGSPDFLWNAKLTYSF